MNKGNASPTSLLSFSFRLGCFFVERMVKLFFISSLEIMK